MNMDIIKYIMIGTGVLFAAVIIVYYILMKKMGKSEYRQMKKLQEGTAVALPVLSRRLCRLRSWTASVLASTACWVKVPAMC